MKNLDMFLEAKTVLLQVAKTINQLNYDEFTQKIELIGNSTIGEHVRHIIELFQQLLNGYDVAIVDYDDRRRNVNIQNNIDFATECIANIISRLEKDDKDLQIKTLYNNCEILIKSNYFRELLYNIEHCIHHQAIIKIGLILLGGDIPDENFGVAKSTIIYKDKCAQ